MRKEEWYRPDLSLYCGMIFVMGKNKLIGIAEALFSELLKEGLEPDTRAYTEMIGAFLQVGMVENAMETYRLMKESGREPDKLTLTILIRNLEKAGEEELASSVMKDSAKYVDFPNRFTKEVKKKHVRILILLECCINALSFILFFFRILVLLECCINAFSFILFLFRILILLECCINALSLFHSFLFLLCESYGSVDNRFIFFMFTNNILLFL